MMVLYIYFRVTNVFSSKPPQSLSPLLVILSPPFTFASKRSPGENAHGSGLANIIVAGQTRSLGSLSSALCWPPVCSAVRSGFRFVSWLRTFYFILCFYDFVVVFCSPYLGRYSVRVFRCLCSYIFLTLIRFSVYCHGTAFFCHCLIYFLYLFFITMCECVFAWKHQLHRVKRNTKHKLMKSSCSYFRKNEIPCFVLDLTVFV